MKEIIHTYKNQNINSNVTKEKPNKLDTIKKRINNIELNVYRIQKILKQQLNSESTSVFNHVLPKDVPTSKKDENNEHVQQKCQSSKFSGLVNNKEFKSKSKNTHKNLKSTKDSDFFNQSEFNPQTQGYNKPEGETKTSDFSPTTSANPNKIINKSKRKRAKANAKEEILKRKDILIGLFANSIPTNKQILTEHDWILEAFHNKFKNEDAKQYILKDENLPEVITAVNGKGFENWTQVARAVQDTLVKINLKKKGMENSQQDFIPIDTEGACLINNWVEDKLQQENNIFK